MAEIKKLIQTSARFFFSEQFSRESWQGNKIYGKATKIEITNKEIKTRKDK